MSTKIAVIKPDHIGDLILAAPAVSWIEQQGLSVTLFVQEKNLSLAHLLFRDIEIKSLNLSHLDKSGEVTRPISDMKDLEQFDLNVFLRSDHLLNNEVLGYAVPRSIFPPTDDTLHESVNHLNCISPFFGSYVRDKVWQRQTWCFQNAPESVGLCIGSGFPANKWSIVKWVSLARRLKKDGVAVSVIGGTYEEKELQILAQLAEIDCSNVICGGSDIQATLDRVSELDVVIASDGGGGHICSLATPVLTVAGSVPFRRFAPFGAGHRTISLDLPCSPCLNAHDYLLNACFSYECSYGLQVEDVLEALYQPDASPGFVRNLKSGTKLFFGPSHVRLPN